MHLRKSLMITVLTLCAALLAGALLASAQEVGEEPSGEIEFSTAATSDPRAGALALLEQAQFALSVTATDDSDPDAAAATVQKVINLLEGESGANYSPAVGVDGDDTRGAIPYLEELTGRSAADLLTTDLDALIEANEETPEVLALAHVLLAQRALLTDGANALDAAAGHVDQAIALLAN